MIYVIHSFTQQALGLWVLDVMHIMAIRNVIIKEQELEL